MGGLWAPCARYGRPNNNLCSLYARYARFYALYGQFIPRTLTGARLLDLTGVH